MIRRRDLARFGQSGWYAGAAWFIAGFLGLLAGCGSAPARFIDGPVVWTLHDDQDIPIPKEQEFWRFRHIIQNFTYKQARLGLDPVPRGPARDVNRLGEVPNSTWYENRIAGLSPEDVGRGPGGADPGPEPNKPWTITGMKSGGQNPGFVFADSRGVRYICKFDKPRTPVIATGAGAVAARLLWAFGYHVPDDRVVFFDRAEIRIDADAKTRDEFGRKRPVTDADIDELLASVPSLTPQGNHRALVSRFLPGRPLGGYRYAGTRPDDPNDRIDHADRRSLRALRVIGAWLNHVDLKIDNTLDLFVEEDGRHFIRHYLVDFDGCLGGYWAARHEARIGFAYDLDLGEAFGGIPLFGLYKRQYENLDGPEHEYVGLFESEVYDAARWTPNYFNDHIEACRPADAFWAGTVLGQISEAHIDAAVVAARYDDPDASSVMARVLKERLAKTIDWALTQVTPVVDLTDPGIVVEGHLHVAARDALSKYGRPSGLQYRIEILDQDGRVIAPVAEAAEAPSFDLDASILDGEHYFIVRWEAKGPSGEMLPPTEGHYLETPANWNLVGILRDGQ